MRKVSKQALSRLVVIFALIALANLVAFFYIKQEQFLYFWDWRNYWTTFISFTDLFRSAPLIAFEELIWNIRSSNYSNLGTIFLIPFGVIFGQSRLVFILSIVAALYGMTIVAYGVFIVLLLNKYYPKTKNILHFVLPLIFFAFFPPMWSPMLRGDIAIGGLIFCFGVMGIIFYKNPNERGFLHYIALSAIFLLTFLYRRWYLVWILSFFVSGVLSDFLYIGLSSKHRVLKFVRSISLWLLSGVLLLILLGTIGKPIFYRVLSVDYSAVYSAYRYTVSFSEYVLNIFSGIGYFYITLFILGLFATLKTSFRLFLFTLGIFVFPVLIFYRFHDFVNQHYYLIVPAIATGTFFFSTWLLNQRLVRKKIIKSSVVLLLIFFTLFNFYHSSFWPDEQSGVCKHFCSKMHLPLKRNDIDEIYRLAKTLDSLDGAVYTLSSSWILNLDMFRDPQFMNHPEVAHLARRLIYAPDIDERDAFSVNQFLSIQYVVIAVPIQAEIEEYKPGSQDSIVIPANLILQNKGIGKAYEKLEYEFNLENGVKVFIYEKVREPSKEDLQLFNTLMEKGA